jgi:hypothetical protein
MPPTKSVSNPVLLGVAPAPAQSAPGVPPGFDPTTMFVRHGAPHVLSAVVAYAQPVADEIRASATFAEDFGPKLSASDIADSLVRARGWRTARSRAAAWYAYLRYGDLKAWEAALHDLVRLRLAYRFGVKVDPASAARHPQLTALFKAMGLGAAKGNATRKRNKQVEADAVAAGRPIVKPAKNGRGKRQVMQAIPVPTPPREQSGM